MTSNNTNTVEERWKQHITQLDNNKHSNEHLQGAWNKYKQYNFKFEVLHKLICSDKKRLYEMLSDLEVMYIKIWNLLDDEYGYNIAQGGTNGSTFAGKSEKEMLEIRIRQSLGTGKYDAVPYIIKSNGKLNKTVCYSRGQLLDLLGLPKLDKKLRKTLGRTVRKNYRSYKF